ncbi:sulfite reductase [NADPH] flavoprotein alpha-component, partial [Staphylococcus warneri]
MTNSPFNEEQAEQLNELLQTLSPEQKMWLSGYILASEQVSNNEKESTSTLNSSDSLQSNQQTEALLAEKEPEVTPESRTITILYG